MAINQQFPGAWIQDYENKCTMQPLSNLAQFGKSQNGLAAVVNSTHWIIYRINNLLIKLTSDSIDQSISTFAEFGCVTFWQAGNRDDHVGDRSISAIDIENGQPSDILSVQHHPTTTSSQ